MAFAECSSSRRIGFRLSASLRELQDFAVREGEPGDAAIDLHDRDLNAAPLAAATLRDALKRAGIVIRVVFDPTAPELDGWRRANF